MRKEKAGNFLVKLVAEGAWSCLSAVMFVAGHCPKGKTALRGI